MAEIDGRMELLVHVFDIGILRPPYAFSLVTLLRELVTSLVSNLEATSAARGRVLGDARD